MPATDKRERRPPARGEDEGYVSAVNKRRKKQVFNDDDDDDGDRSRSPLRRRSQKAASRRQTEIELEDVEDDSDESGEDDDDEEEEEEGDEEDGEEGSEAEDGEGSAVKGSRLADKLPSLEEIMEEAREKGQQREDARQAGGRHSEKQQKKRKGTKSGNFAAIQAPPGGMMRLLPMIQAMVTQAMQGALQGGSPSSVATSHAPRNTSGATNKYNTPKTLKTIGMAVHAVFENGSLEGGFYTTVDPIAKMARVLLKVPEDDYDWTVGWVANHGELWQAAATKQMQQRSEVVKKVKHRLHLVYNIRKPKSDYNGFLADIAPLQGTGFRVRNGDPLGDVRLKKVIGHVFLANWNERVDELHVFIQQAAIVVAVIDMVIGNPQENRAPSDRLPNDGSMALHYEACIKTLQAEVDEFAGGAEYPFIRAPEPSLFMNGEDKFAAPPNVAQTNSYASSGSVRTPLASQPVNVGQSVAGTNIPGVPSCPAPAQFDPQAVARAVAMLMSGAGGNMNQPSL
ncbi:hypothetical protein KFL_002960090 [Klebsormidium nitens]|uniref:Uncharacterized protein n=1 Tax=Klebsormidium nitens TaxID=105231 RepID=A0A1Y1I6G8_KLENI|nr:hypothetical protein KFL_002960090 [Klebsormidium nitens]|eukprot:GAQ86554.1 hypothetical protein KFL_002960090 [Klebsormidium nitens]